LDVAGEELRERARVEALARRQGILRVLPHRLRSERDEPPERIVEALVDQTLQVLVAVGTLPPEVVPLAMPPDHAAREQHRAAGTSPLLDEARAQTELARTRGTDEPGHAG